MWVRYLKSNPLFPRPDLRVQYSPICLSGPWPFDASWQVRGIIIFFNFL